MKTPTIRYYLQNQKKQTVDQRIRKEPIMVEINYGYVGLDGKSNKRAKPFRVALNASIEPVMFGKANCNFKFDEEVFKKATRNNATIRTKMGRLQESIDLLVDRYVLADIVPPPSQFKSDLLVELGRVKREIAGEHSILAFLYNKIEKDEENLLGNKRSKLSKDTIKIYKSLSHHIENYEIATSEKLTFEGFDNDKYWEFWNVINDIFKDKIKVINPKQPRKQRKNKTGYASSAIQKYQKNLMKVMRDARKSKTIKSIALDFDDEDLILADTEAMKKIYVNIDELKLILDSNVEDNYDLQKAKDYVVLSTLMGMRYQSMVEARNEKVEVYIDDDYDFQYIHSRQNKTKTEVCIPLLEPVKEVLSRHNNEFPKIPDNQLINKYIKSLFDYVGINDNVKLTRVTYNNGTLISTVSKAEVISTHDSKGGFYSNLRILGMKENAIDNITHPDKPKKNVMAKFYDKTDMLDRAKMFVDEINKIDSEIYKF